MGKQVLSGKQVGGIYHETLKEDIEDIMAKASTPGPQGPQGAQGEKGEPGSVVVLDDSTYTHDQQLASDLWVINHPLGKYPAVTIIDTANSVVTGDIQYISLAQLTITFSAAFSGKAILN